MIRRWLAEFDAFLYGYLVMVLGCIYFLFNYVEDISFSERAGESVLFRACWLLLYALLALHLIRDARRFALLLFHSRLLLLFVALAVVSMVVDGISSSALVKFAMYIATILFAAHLVLSRSVDELVEALFRIGVVVLVAHVLLFPVIGSAIDYDALHRPTILGTQAYAGVFGHKNLAGSFFGMMVMISLIRALCGPRPQFGWSALAMLLHFLALAATGAAGPLISLMAALTVTLGLLLVVLGRKGAASIYWLVLGFAGLVLLAMPTDLLYAMVGRTEGLTGRSFLWSVWPHFFAQRPWLGYGFSGFFSGLPNAPSTELTRMAPWNSEFGSFENSYLDALLQFGLLGGVTYLMMVGSAVWHSIVFAFEREGVFWLAPFAMLIFIVVGSFNDSSQLLHNYFACVVVFWCYFGPELRLQAQTRWALASTRLSKART